MVKNVVHKLSLNLYEKAQNNEDDVWTCIFEHIFLKGVIIHIRFIHFTGGKGLKKQVTILPTLHFYTLTKEFAP